MYQQKCPIYRNSKAVRDMVLLLMGRLSSLIAFAMSAPPLYSLCMQLAIASTVFLYLAVYFTFQMSKVWPSSPNTFVTNSFLVGCPAALMGRRNFLDPLNLGLASDMFSLSFSVCTTGGVPSKEACTADNRRGSTRLLINNVDATY